MPERLHLQNVGPINDARIDFGDLTVLVGPQATGKSILLQFHKLLLDRGRILAQMKRYCLDWGDDLGGFLDSYFGEGMRGLWSSDASKIHVDGKEIDLGRIVSRQRKNQDEALFFIPAQRVLTLGKGWPRPFNDYSPGDPFVVRDFSEKLRTLMESEIGASEKLFPRDRRFKLELRQALDDAVFAGFGLGVDRYNAQKRLVLTNGDDGAPFPYMVWSAGQREFVPLLLGLYWLLPPSRIATRDKIRWVVIEEPEMGLHPQAISVALLLVLELLGRGYRVCLSTHSPHVLDVVWAMRVIHESGADPAHLLRVFGLKPTPSMRKIAAAALRKTTCVYYFDRIQGQAHDISKLDPGAADQVEAGWGGLTEFSGRVQDIVAEVMRGE